MNSSDKIQSLTKFYSLEKLLKLTTDQIDFLFEKSKPKKVSISSLKDMPVENYLVNSLDGFVPVIEWRNKGTKECVEIQTQQGKRITASYDHFFEMSTDKWKYGQYIRIGEYLKTKTGFDKVIEVKNIGKKTVYDLHINHKNHRYLTNDISSHNSGGGKSLFLANLGVNWALMGLNVIYFTFELSEGLVSMRLDSMTTGIGTREIFRNIDDVELKVKMLQKKSGHLQIKYMPSGKNVNDLRAYLKEYQVKNGLKPDVLLIDYLDLMMPLSVKVSPSDLFVKDKYVSEELRNLAMETQCITVTASQLNRCLTLDTVLTSNGNKIKIGDIKVGDWIDSNQGSVQVLEKLPIVKQAVYKIKTKSGKTIMCSDRHLFPTNNGLRSITNGLSIGDKLHSRSLEQNSKEGVADIGKGKS